MTSVASIAYAPPRTIDRADQVKGPRRSPAGYYKYNRNPHVPFGNGPKYADSEVQEPPCASAAEEAARLNK